MRHGRTGYEKHGCRCAVCRAANTAHVAAVRARRLLRLSAAPDDAAHGTIQAYDAGCRCPDCKTIRAVRYHTRERQPARPHRWRELVTSAYRSARTAWEARFETETGETYQPGIIGRERCAERRGGRREVTDYLDHSPPPTLGQFLTGYSGYLINNPRLA